MYRLFFSLIVVFVLENASAREVGKDSISSSDSARKALKIRPAIRLGVDVSRLFLSAISKDFRAAEASLDFNRGRLIWGAHAGFAQRTFSLSGQDAFSSGYYVSAGLCRNVFNESNNILAFGGRLAASVYRHQPRNISLLNPYTGKSEFQNLDEGSGRQFWLEFVSTMRAKVVGWVMAGFELRLKYRLPGSHTGEVPYFIPGFGLRENRLSLGFNYFIFINLPAKK